MALDQDARAADLSSVPRNHMVEGENQLLQVVLWPARTHMYTHAYKISNMIFKAIS